MAVVFEPTHDAIVRNIAPQKITAVAKIDRALGPTETCRNSLDRRIADPGLEPFVEHLDTRIGIAPVGKVAQWQEVCFGRPEYCRGSSHRCCGQERPSLHHDFLPSPASPRQLPLPFRSRR